MSVEEPRFSNERFMSADEKRKVLRAWIRFLRNGCQKTQFTQDLYRHLIQHCSFIAHYDRHGFYNVYFERPTADVFRFFDQFDPQKPGISAEYGTTHWLGPNTTGADLNAAMREAAGPFIGNLRRHFAETQRQAELAAAARLLEKHGLTAVSAGPGPVIVCEPTTQPTQTAHPVQPQLFAD